MKGMKSETIKAIFTNVLFVVGVILLILGFVWGTTTAIKLVSFDQYPLPYYDETRCEMEYESFRFVPEGAEKLSDEEAAERLSRCKSSLDYQRQVKQTEDIATAITTFVAGLVMVIIFRRYILK